MEFLAACSRDIEIEAAKGEKNSSQTSKVKWMSLSISSYLPASSALISSMLEASADANLFNSPSARSYGGAMVRRSNSLFKSAVRHALCSFEDLLRFLEKMRLQRAVNVGQVAI